MLVERFREDKAFGRLVLENMMVRSLVKKPVDARLLLAIALGTDSERRSAVLLTVLVGELDVVGVCEVLPYGV